RHTRSLRDWSSDVCSSDLGDVLATQRDEAYRSELTEARSELEIAESELARHRTDGNSALMAQALSRRDELRAKIDFAESRLAWRSEERRVGKECGCGGWRG